MTDNRVNARRMVKGQWYWLDKSIIRYYTPRIGALGIAVYCYMASLADVRQTCYPSQKHIAKVLGYSRTTINRVIKRLEHARLIQVDRSGRYQHIYTLLKVSCDPEETQV